MAATRASAVGMCSRRVRSACPTRGPPCRARIPTKRTRPSAKSSTCNAPGYRINRATYSVTSCSGLIQTSTATAFSPKSFSRSVKSAERTRAIFFGVRYSVQAIGQASMLTSSLLVNATRISVAAIPAASRMRGLAALPFTVRMSRRSCRSRRISSFVSMTVTSFASSRERWYAAVRQTCPAPKMMIFTAALLYTNEIGVRQHQPLRTLPLEIDLDSGMRSIALEIEHHPIAELRMPDAAAHAHIGVRRLLHAAVGLGEYRPRHLQPRPDLLHQIRGQLADEAGRLPIGIHPVEASLLRISQIELLHGPRQSDVGEAALLLETRQIGDRALVRK